MCSAIDDFWVESPNHFPRVFFVRAVAAFCHCWFKSSFHWLTRSNVMLCNQCKIILFRGFDKTSLLFLFLCSNRHDPVHYHSGILVWFWLGLQHALQHLINLPGAFHSLPSCSTWTLSLILKVFIIYVHIHRNLVASHCVTEKLRRGRVSKNQYLAPNHLRNNNTWG